MLVLYVDDLTGDGRGKGAAAEDAVRATTPTLLLSDWAATHTECVAVEHQHTSTSLRSGKRSCKIKFCLGIVSIIIDYIVIFVFDGTTGLSKTQIT